jgi:hypothetical protein
MESNNAYFLTWRHLSKQGFFLDKINGFKKQ